MSRRLRSILPTTAKQLQPQVVSQQAVRERREICQQRQQLYFNRTARPLPHLPEGTPIRFRQQDGSWTPATVTRPAHTDRSYHIPTSGGQTYRRNRRHLRESREIHLHDSGDVATAEVTQQPVPSASDTQVHHREPVTPPDLNSQTATPQPGYTTRSGRAVKPRQVLDL